MTCLYHNNGGATNARVGRGLTFPVVLGLQAANGNKNQSQQPIMLNMKELKCTSESVLL